MFRILLFSVSTKQSSSYAEVVFQLHFICLIRHVDFPFQPSTFGLYDDFDTDGLEPGEIRPGQPFLGSAVEWPKVRVLHLLALWS